MIVRVRKYGRTGQKTLNIPKGILEKVQIGDFMSLELEGNTLRYRPLRVEEIL